MNSLFKFKLPIILAAITLVLGLLCSGAIAQEPNTWYVDAEAEEAGNGTESKPFQTIQEAIDAVSTVDGDIISVATGTYDVSDSIVINKKVTVKGIPEGDGALPTIKGTLTVKSNVYTPIIIENMNFEANTDHNIILDKAKNVVIKKCRFDGKGKFMDGGKNAVNMNGRCDGITIEGCTFKDGFYVAVNGYADNLTVKDSTIENCKSGINLQVGNNLVVSNTNISVIAQGAGNDTYCVRFASESANSASNMNITGGTFSVNKNGLTASEGAYHSAIIIRTGATGPLTVKDVSIDGEVINLSGTSLTAIHNWWGHATGPTHVSNPGGKGDIFTGNVEFLPWYVDEAMTTLSTTGIGYIESGSTDLTFDQSGVRMEIKTDVKDCYISVTRFAAGESDAPAGMIPAGIYLRIEHGEFPEGTSARIEIEYDPEKLPEGVKEDDLRLYRYNEETEQWDLVSSQGIDKENGILWAELDDFSDFGIFADAPEEPEPDELKPEEPGKPEDEPKSALPRTYGGLSYFLLLGLFMLSAGFLLIRKKGLQGR